MKKECSCKKIIKYDKITLITECDVCYKKKNKTFKLCIKLAELIVKINIGKDFSKKPIPDYQKGYVNKGDLNIVADGKDVNYKETIVTTNGNVVTPKNKSVGFTGQLGSYVYSQEEWNSKLNHILRSKGLNDSQPFGFAPIENDFQKGMLEADKELQRVCKQPIVFALEPVKLKDAIKYIESNYIIPYGKTGVVFLYEEDGIIKEIFKEGWPSRKF